ncbi:PIN domain-containing protein [Halocatena salina]|uniref:PIN domain-containing protein n=1 Tax=Halocatena salina TaxID=2934340 RepID=A0A8U0A0M6_9EURY|nr:PIN domain-containing protein [Halocatena salina]UPM42670.1 hypothetical protein MW046_12000 [Halocatena salina]
MIDVLNDRGDVPTQLEAYADPFHALAILFSEVLEGLYASGKSEAVAAKHLSWLSLLAFTFEAAREAARVRQELRRRGEVIPDADTFIAGTVRAESGTLITTDQRFESVPDLDCDVL